MSAIEEKSYLLNTSEYGLTLFQDAAALEDRINEWFDTPAGTVADFPSWGHNLTQFKFEPPGIILNSMTEMAIIDKIRYDIPDILVKMINVEFTEIDLLMIRMDVGIGTKITFEKQL